MGIFPDYTKVGPGVDKNAPKKRGIFLYFELLGRYFWKIVKSNMLYTAISLPVLMLYHYIFLCVFGSAYGIDGDITVINRNAVLVTVLLAILWGTGPVSCGFTHLLRGMAREEHVWISLDFFKRSKECFKHSLVFLLVDVAVVLTSVVSLSVYATYAETKSALFLIPSAIIVVGLILYTFMHFFMYEFEITFENSIKEVYKNSFIMAIATFPMCIFITAIICVLSYCLLGVLTGIAIVIITFLCWVGIMRFIIDFYSARLIKRRFLKETPEESEN